VRILFTYGPLCLHSSPPPRNAHPFGTSVSGRRETPPAAFTSRSVILGASPEAVAVGFDERVLISTIDTGAGQSVLITFDPNAAASHALQSIVIAPQAPPQASEAQRISSRGPRSGKRSGERSMALRIHSKSLALL
jgi:hypothetical protein